MARFELTLSQEQKAEIDAAAKASGLRPATWAKATLILAARKGKP